MARMDGVEATRRIRALLPNTVRDLSYIPPEHREVEGALRCRGECLSSQRTGSRKFMSIAQHPPHDQIGSEVTEAPRAFVS